LKSQTDSEKSLVMWLALTPITLLISEQETKNDVPTRNNFCL
jgi:hypothetical protein